MAARAKGAMRHWQNPPLARGLLSQSLVAEILPADRFDTAQSAD
jgi:hypothetical protein